MKKVWFITGSARGLGRNLTEIVLANGDQIVATSKSKNKLDDLLERYPRQILPVDLDVTQIDEIDAAIKVAVERFGQIDVLVNNAGFGIAGAAEGYTENKVSTQICANLYGAIAITRRVLPIMRKQLSGRILQISSLGGRIGNAGLSIYHAAKFGLTGFSEALSKEVNPLGIKVTSVEPGSLRTDWGGSSMGFGKHVDGYELTVDKMIRLRKDGNYVPSGDPVKAAQVIYDLAYHPEPPVHLVLGSDAVKILKKANAASDAEFDKWLDISNSIDHDDVDHTSNSDIKRVVPVFKG